MRYYVKAADRVIQVDLSPEGVILDGVGAQADLTHIEGTGLGSLLLDGASFRVLADRGADGRWALHLGGRRYELEVVDERTWAIRKMTGTGDIRSGPRPIRAPMPGLVVKVEVGIGDRLDVGQSVAIVEAMKMENELKAEGPGVVSRIHVAAGQTVEKDQILIELEAPGATGETA